MAELQAFDPRVLRVDAATIHRRVSAICKSAVTAKQTQVYPKNPVLVRIAINPLAKNKIL